MSTYNRPVDEDPVDRSLQTDARAEPARPDGGTASGAFEVELYRPELRAGFFELMHGVGRSHIDDAEFEWWFDRNPVGRRLISLGVDDSRVVGVAAMSFFRMLLGGEERAVAIPVHVATEAPYRRQGIFSELELNNEREAAADGSPITITFPNAASHRIFVGRLGWIDLPGRRVWARPLRAAGVARYLARRPSPRGGRSVCITCANLTNPIAVENCGFSTADVTPQVVSACARCAGISKISSAR